MTTVIDKVVSAGLRGWRVSWSTDHVPADGSLPEFRIYIDGALADVTTSTSRVFIREPGRFPVIEVRDATEPGFTAANSPKRRFVWLSTANTDHYRLEQLIDSVWTLIRLVTHDGRAEYSPESDVMADSETHQFRVIPVGTNGNQGAAVTVSVTMIRHPDPPDSAMDYDPATKKITVTVT